MNLAPLHLSNAKVATRRKNKKTTKPLSPEEYAKAVQGYSLLPTGEGQNYISLGEFLTNDKAASIDFHRSSFENDFVTLYHLGCEDQCQAPGSSSPPARPNPSASDQDPNSADERRHEHSGVHFNDPNIFFRHNVDQSRPQSCIIFLRGYMSAAWINNIGARYIVDPEFFCRHLAPGLANDYSNNFSVPALPSSSWHLIELPVITISTRVAPKRLMRLDRIEELRHEGTEALAAHHHRIAKFSSSGMSVGESIVRDFFVFDETFFAIEQRITICMQTNRSGKGFSLLVWLDSGSDTPRNPPLPWSTQPPQSYLLPIIRHKHMSALKCHLFKSADSGDTDPFVRQFQSASQLSDNYGRSLRPNIMRNDAFYSLTEVFTFAASSHIEFLNLIDSKLYQYTSLPFDQDVQSLPNLKYTKEILHRHIQKTQRILDSIRSAKHPKWPKDESESGSRKAATAAQNLEQDFVYLLNRAVALHQRTAEAITVLMSSISISESQKAIEQAQRVGKLTFLAFIFVPLSFTTSFFGMNVKEFGGPVGLVWWVVMSIPLASGAMLLFYLNVKTDMRDVWRDIRNWLVTTRLELPWQRVR